MYVCTYVCVNELMYICDKIDIYVAKNYVLSSTYTSSGSFGVIPNFFAIVSIFNITTLGMYIIIRNTEEAV